MSNDYPQEAPDLSLEDLESAEKRLYESLSKVTGLTGEALDREWERIEKLAEDLDYNIEDL